MKYAPETQAFTVRWPKYAVERLKELHASTYSDHRLPFNQWLLAQIEKSTSEKQ